MDNLNAVLEQDGQYARQESLALNVPQRVHVVGCGGVGSWVAITLAMAGVPEIWLWDNDTISSHNLNRIPLPPEVAMGGMEENRKSHLIARMIGTLRPECHVVPMGRWGREIATMVASGVDSRPSWLVCTTDTWANRKDCAGWAIEHFVKYIEASAEGEYGGAASSPAEWATPEEHLPGYASVPVWIGPCLQAAVFACSYILHDQTPGRDMTARAGFNGENYEFQTRN